MTIAAALNAEAQSSALLDSSASMRGADRERCASLLEGLMANLTQIESEAFAKLAAALSSLAQHPVELTPQAMLHGANVLSSDVPTADGFGDAVAHEVANAIDIALVDWPISAVAPC